MGRGVRPEGAREKPPPPSPFLRVPLTHPTTAQKAKMCQMQNYFSVGADAEVARRFDVARSAHPERFRSAFVNKVKYALYGSTLALFGASSLEKRLASLSIDGVDVPIPKGAKLF